MRSEQLRALEEGTMGEADAQGKRTGIRGGIAMAERCGGGCGDALEAASKTSRQDLCWSVRAQKVRSKILTSRTFTALFCPRHPLINHPFFFSPTCSKSQETAKWVHTRRKRTGRRGRALPAMAWPMYVFFFFFSYFHPISLTFAGQSQGRKLLPQRQEGQGAEAPHRWNGTAQCCW